MLCRWSACNQSLLVPRILRSSKPLCRSTYSAVPIWWAAEMYRSVIYARKACESPVVGSHPVSYVVCPSPSSSRLVFSLEGSWLDSFSYWMISLPAYPFDLQLHIWCLLWSVAMHNSHLFFYYSLWLLLSDDSFFWSEWTCTLSCSLVLLGGALFIPEFTNCIHQLVSKDGKPWGKCFLCNIMALLCRTSMCTVCLLTLCQFFHWCHGLFCMFTRSRISKSSFLGLRFVPYAYEVREENISLGGQHIYLSTRASSSYELLLDVLRHCFCTPLLYFSPVHNSYPTVIVNTLHLSLARTFTRTDAIRNQCSVLASHRQITSNVLILLPSFLSHLHVAHHVVVRIFSAHNCTKEGRKEDLHPLENDYSTVYPLRVPVSASLPR